MPGAPEAVTPGSPQPQLAVEVLLDWTLTEDGSGGVLRVLADDGTEMDVVLALPLLPHVVQALVDLAATADRLQVAPPMPLVQSVHHWQVSPVARSERRLLTLTTEGGEQQSFLISTEALDDIAAAAGAALSAQPLTH